MEKDFTTDLSGFTGLSGEEVKHINAGCILAAIATGIAAMNLACQDGKDLARMSK